MTELFRVVASFSRSAHLGHKGLGEGKSPRNGSRNATKVSGVPQHAGIVVPLHIQYAPYIFVWKPECGSATLAGNYFYYIANPNLLGFIDVE
jgi:hypothetical protein